jgi:hypothetical protein
VALTDLEDSINLGEFSGEIKGIQSSLPVSVKRIENHTAWHHMKKNQVQPKSEESAAASPVEESYTESHDLPAPYDQDDTASPAAEKRRSEKAYR